VRARGRERAAAEASDPGARISPEVFEASYDFPFDSFQRRALAALEQGLSVLVAAPTGAGKTVVGEFAAHLALRGGGRTFYTAPIKALSNQKFADFCALYGPRNVGLLTGDNSVNGDAPVVVMTTEVLRNMIYEDSEGLDTLHCVVLDEVHYLQDRYRGAVWEEILIHLPVEVLTVSLSATVSNAEEFARWLQTIRGPTEVIIEEHRPVEIRHWYFASDELLPMFVQRPGGGPIPNSQARAFDPRRSRGAERPRRGGKRPHTRRRQIPARTDVAERLHGEGMLPAIYFIFSRRGCDAAVARSVAENVRLTTPQEQRAITQLAEERTADFSPDELAVLGYDELFEGLTRGVAAHHAGMIPPFKEIVEDLFKQGLIKIVFATETLALGINMPARTVVIESLMKFTGEKHEMITPGQYTQLSGRAGRRGIDELGHSVVLLQRFASFDQISRLASTRTYPLLSSFTPSYNMAVNLMRNYDRSEAEHLVNSSFAQFQADREVVELEQTRARLDGYLASYREKASCEYGDIGSYVELQRRVKETQEQRGRASRDAVAGALSALRPGDVVDLPGGKRRGRHVVIDVSEGQDRGPRLQVMSEERAVTWLQPYNLSAPPRVAGRLRLPPAFQPKDARSRRLLARRLSRLHVERSPQDSVAEEASDDLQRALEEHPSKACPELNRHLHFWRRAVKLEREVAGIERRVSRRSQTLSRRFERVLEVLYRLGCVSGWALTPKGETLARIYNESDLLVVEALEEGIFEGLDSAELAGLLSSLVYETRGPEMDVVVLQSTKGGGRAWERLVRLWGEISSEEQMRGLELTREPDPGFSQQAYRWASGAGLEDVLGPDDAAGDFVRSTKQLIDLVRQLIDAVPEGDLLESLRTCADSLHRGVVAYSSLEL